MAAQVSQDTGEGIMDRILPEYVRRSFLGFFLFCLLCVVSIFLVVDIVEKLDRFIDRSVPRNVIIQYYLYYIPYVLVLTIPVACLLATVFSVGNLARHNEIVAMKSLGYSLYRLLGTYLMLAVCISIFSFIIAEVLVVYTHRKKEEINRTYMVENQQNRTSLSNKIFQDTPNRIVYIGDYDSEKSIASGVNVFSFRDGRLVSRLDTKKMEWNGNSWIVRSGNERVFFGDEEILVPIQSPLKYSFKFSPNDIFLAHLKPQERSVWELGRLIDRLQESKGAVQSLQTDYYLRFAFPFGNIIIVLLSVPIVYNRRKRSLAVGFGISLVICFIYFGLVKIGQVMGQNGSLHSIPAAWLGNGVLGIVGVIDLIKTRK